VQCLAPRLPCHRTRRLSHSRSLSLVCPIQIILQFPSLMPHTGIRDSCCILCVLIQTLGQLLTRWQVQTAVEHRTVDKSLLFQVASGRFLCSLAARILRYTKQRLAVPLNARIKQYYSVHMFHAMARLDLPTFDDPKVQRQLESSFPQSSRSSIAWDTVTMISHIMTTVVQLVSQLSVLIRVLNDQQDGPLLALLSFAEALFQRSAIREPFFHRGGVHLSFNSHVRFIHSHSLGRNHPRCGLHPQ